MPRTPRFPAKEVVLPQIESGDYPAMTALVGDLHETWQGWQREITAFEMSARRQGRKVVYVPVAPASFSAWAEANGKAVPSSDDLTTYALAMAARR